MSAENVETSLGVQSELMSLQKVFKQDLLFKIPSYQRPYVWSDDDVLKLFEDIKNACFRKERHYFIGTTLSSCVGDGETNILELVDGQQRTTTLMLICIAFKHAEIASDLSELAVFKGEGEYKDTPRLQFDIRESVQQLFGAKAGLKSHQVPSPEQIKSNPYLTQIDAALTVLVKEVQKLNGVAEKGGDTSVEKVSAEQLSRFIYEKVQWVNNIVPPDTDLNRLFATMNTAGVQLEQSDILKAKLLKHISAESKPRYEAIWAACEQMENYFERNVRQVFSATSWAGIEPSDLAEFGDKFVGKATESTAVGEGEGRSIAELLKSGVDADTKADDGNHADTDGADAPSGATVYCRSIVSFPLLLIHAYRIFRLEQEPKLGDIHKPVHSKYLLEIFKPLLGESYAADKKTTLPASSPDEESIKAFFKTLWRVRYVFDRWVAKWVERDDESEQRLGLTTQSASDSNDKRYINRSERSPDAMLMLQSVRYFTSDRNAQYWLTPFLACLMKEKVSDHDVALALLERIDNQMSLATVTRKDASFAYAAKHELVVKPWAEQEAYFRESLGTGFGHYWFQKLEYLLWKQLKADSTILTDAEKLKFENYRISSKNSVEHVHPQNEEYRKTLQINDLKSNSDATESQSSDPLNAFGNLVLLSPGENSSYSNQAVLKKQADFIEKPQIASLKLLKIFKEVGNHSEWTSEKIEAHETSMIEAFGRHYSQLKCDVVVS